MWGTRGPLSPRGPGQHRYHMLQATSSPFTEHPPCTSHAIAPGETAVHEAEQTLLPVEETNHMQNKSVDRAFIP